MKIHLDTIGCRLNQAEIEQMARQFRAEGHTLVSQAAEADLVVVNTCAVTSEAAADSRQKIRQAARAGAGEIIVTGCWSSLQPQQAAELPRVRRVIPNERKDHLVAEVLGLPAEHFDLEPLAREALPGLRQRTRAFIKVQDGCDNACTFCITTVARGAGRSRPIAEVLADVRAALTGGTQEVVLTGVHLGSWGQDFGQSLSVLVRAILNEMDIPRLRLSSLEPWDLNEDFFSLWENPRLLPHLHLPLQSGSASVLKRMLRKTTPASFRQLVQAARAAIPAVAITTDVIAGFPGETEEEFRETLDFVREIGFAGGHVFTYSSRPGTPAARMKNHVSGEVKRTRSAQLRTLFAELSETYRKQFVGDTLSVLWETTSELDEWGWQMEGLTGNYIRVSAHAPSPRWNVVDRVKITALSPDGLRGEIVAS
ncbi:MAG: tRNA (N(6)-L-threonylcarbamoyladenosine(37)-C(2))-methylthiotransferase MtaB [Anaerolineales bacterium]|nr:tRNA (N(6)-L-threonylcarbamoyladenosine(37)-C(2))-methylthiotransferase MtaB [Anaerolineales bacterium]MDW8277246.1 tRNA (N(6)-L-threonylcarbamoyladenosine(37)-C(2))-methylthiotransferase MtaB [Anaerolineales bacterium]